MTTARPGPRLSRHARNKLRWIARDAPGVTAERVLAALPTGKVQGYDRRDDEKLVVDVNGVTLVVVLDAEADLVITIWRS